MPEPLNSLPNEVSQLKSLLVNQTVLVKKLESENQQYKHQVLTLQEQLNLAIARRYAASSEKIPAEQLRLFDEAELDIEAYPPEPEDDSVTVPEHNRRKRGRKKLPDTLPRVDVVYDLSEADRIAVCMSFCSIDRLFAMAPPELK